MEAMRASDVLQDAMRTTGAVVMGRRSYEMGEGDYTGYEYQVPLFVLTHHVPAQVAKGENENLSFTFVTDGIESIIAKAKAAAGDRDVMIVGGAEIAQQCLKAGLVDEIQISLMPVLLGEGLRFFDHLGSEAIELETLRVLQDPGVTHLFFRVIK